MKRILLTAFSFVLVASAARSGSSAVPAAEGGAALFTAHCAQCHVTTSTDTKIGPGLKGLFKNKTLPGTGRPATVANVTAQIKNGGGGMPGFASDFDAAQIADLIGYLKTL